ncbi:hypothetical protein N7516_000133 [Penicillium verrucosum]|uniref:uncharacterized protein n=1 Tax=Penicillium verrucosum TaxID=60171 RepID=UPI002544E530|nr:uncharacterized protein N7516_000133 [Penicillium verrucosum]KAJ5939965.1 hypothetical protein N7516_000133 [Penicillium verrucosum]
MSNSKLARGINIALTTTATSTSTASLSASTVFNKHADGTARAQTLLVDTHHSARTDNATIFALESSIEYSNQASLERLSLGCPPLQTEACARYLEVQSRIAPSVPLGDIFGEYLFPRIVRI